MFAAISSGSETAFHTLFERYRQELYNLSLKLSRSTTAAEEIVQEIFIGLWISRQHLSQVDDPQNYLYRILLNKVSEYLKKESNHQIIIRNSLQFGTTVSKSTEDMLDLRESQRIINKLVNTLPEQQKKVYTLSRVHGCSNLEIAGHLNISTHTVKSHLSKALLSIRNGLREVAVIMLALNF